MALVVSKSLDKEDLVNRSVWKWEKEKEKQNQSAANSIGGVTDQEFLHAVENDQIHLYDSAYHNSYIHYDDGND